MATTVRHIRSYYDPETERDDLLLETGQVWEPTFSGEGHIRGGIGFTSGGEKGRTVNYDSEREEEVDPWLVELPYAPAGFSLPLKFVKSVLSYEDVNDYIERGHESGLFGRVRGKAKDAEEEEERREISNWYRNLSRTNTNTLVPALVQGESDQKCTPDAPSQKPPQSTSRPRSNPRRRNDWFVSNVLSHPSLTSSGSNFPAPRPPPTLADMLARDPPPNKSQGARAYIPPPWIMLPPSNPGFRMLQKSGWSEGEPLGPHFSRKQGVVHREQQPVAGPSNPGKRKAAPEVRTTEVQIEGYDDIVEIKKEQVIDLTVSDDEAMLDEGFVELDGETTFSGTLSADFTPTSPQLSSPWGEGHGGKALLTPLPTVLKSDRLGIGLKAKTIGPYRASQKRVTHNSAALAAHIKANDERKLFKQKVGKGSRGFARAEKREIENRKNLLAYLNK